MLLSNVLIVFNMICVRIKGVRNRCRRHRSRSGLVLDVEGDVNGQDIGTATDEPYGSISWSTACLILNYCYVLIQIIN